MKKITVILVSFLLLTIVGINQIKSKSININENILFYKDIDNTNSHLIDDVPIIGQDTRFYCTISSHTMILNYYGFNLTKYEVFYLMGGGFSLLYRSTRYLKPYSSVGIAFRPSHYEYVASLLNIEFQPFYIDLIQSEDIVWEKIWTCIKENITLNQPVLINLDESVLFSENMGIKLPPVIWKLIPVHADHSVVVVGYNESNNTVCYNDPMYSIFGDEKKGAYIWVNAEILKTSFTKFTKHSPFFPSTYRIKTYKKPEYIQYNKDEIFEQTYNRNIKRLQGDSHYYISDVDYPGSHNITSNSSYGINASKEIQNIFREDINTQIFTLLQYKIAGKLGIKNSFFNLIEKSFQKSDNDISLIFDLAVPGYKNIYKTIAEEKLIASEVVLKYSHLSQKYKICSDLLINESEQWLKISDNNRILLNKGFFISLPKAIIIFNQISNIMDNIIKIEQDILSLED